MVVFPVPSTTNLACVELSPLRLRSSRFPEKDGLARIPIYVPKVFHVVDATAPLSEINSMGKAVVPEPP